jgi:hypothetical protein
MCGKFESGAAMEEKAPGTSTTKEKKKKQERIRVLLSRVTDTG